MSRLTWDGTAKPVSRDQIIRRERGQGNTIFAGWLTASRIGNHTRLIHTLLFYYTSYFVTVGLSNTVQLRLYGKFRDVETPSVSFGLPSSVGLDLIS